MTKRVLTDIPRGTNPPRGSCRNITAKVRKVEDLNVNTVMDETFFQTKLNKVKSWKRYPEGTLRLRADTNNVIFSILAICTCGVK